MVSIIVPIFNVVPYLRQCLDSIVNQTYQDLEIILVDDGSTDGCATLADEYAMRDNRIQVIHQANMGLSAARNAGISRASGQYILFIDSDDYIAPNACETLVKAAENGQYDVVVFSRRRFINESEYTDDSFDEEQFASGIEYINAHLTGKFSHSACHKLCKRSLIQGNKIYFEPGLYEDCYFSFRLLYTARQTKVISDILYFYRVQRPTSIVNTINEQDTDVLLTIQRLEQWLANKQDHLAETDAFKIYLFDWIFGAIIIKYPCKILCNAKAHKITQSIIRDVRFHSYVQAITSMSKAGWKRRLCAWTMIHCYGLFAISVYTMYHIKHYKH